ncbi:MAG: HIT family protein [Bacilli bacterium]
MDCIFCKILNGDIPSYTIYEDDDVKCFLDVNPMHNGHNLIIPKKHIKDMYDIDLMTLSKINEVAKKVMELVNEKLKPSGIRLLQHNGSVQDVKHFHLHIIPIYEKEEKMEVEQVYNILTK